MEPGKITTSGPIIQGIVTDDPSFIGKPEGKGGCKVKDAVGNCGSGGDNESGCRGQFLLLRSLSGSQKGAACCLIKNAGC